MAGAEVKSLDYPSEFYRLPTRDDAFTLSDFIRVVASKVQALGPFDVVFTHNMVGEYGHLDHKLIWDIAFHLGHPLWITNIFIPSNWVPWQQSPVSSLDYPKWVSELDVAFYDRCESVYRRHNAWTWNKEAVTHCAVYEL